MTMTNERDSYETTKTAPVPTPLPASGPFVAVTPTVANPDPHASAAFYATVRKDLATRGQRGEAV
jgi:hypothetical protein